MNNHSEQSQSDLDDQLMLGINSKKIIQSIKARSDEKRTLSEKIADGMTQTFGSIPFLILNTIWFVSWILINTNSIPGITPFDPFPFGFLTMIVSLEAIVLAIFVLISQNRAARIDDLREEVDLKIDIVTEQELTKLLQLFVLLMEKNGFILSDDKELREMIHQTNMKKIERVLEKEIT